MNTLLWILLIVLAVVATRWYYRQKLATAYAAIKILNEANQGAAAEIAEFIAEKARFENKSRQVNEREDRLVSAINHFYNNTLARYTGHLELLFVQLQKIGNVPQSCFEKLEEMQKAAHQLAKYVQSFSRPVTRQEKIDEYLEFGQKR